MFCRNIARLAIARDRVFLLVFLPIIIPIASCLFPLCPPYYSIRFTVQFLSIPRPDTQFHQFAIWRLQPGFGHRGVGHYLDAGRPPAGHVWCICRSGFASRSSTEANGIFADGDDVRRDSGPDSDRVGGDECHYFSVRFSEFLQCRRFEFLETLEESHGHCRDAVCLNMRPAGDFWKPFEKYWLRPVVHGSVTSFAKYSKRKWIFYHALNGEFHKSWKKSLKIEKK